MTENGYDASVIASDHGAESLPWDLTPGGENAFSKRKV
jgi:hypothetical protein